MSCSNADLTCESRNEPERSSMMHTVMYRWSDMQTFRPSHRDEGERLLAGMSRATDNAAWGVHFGACRGGTQAADSVCVTPRLHACHSQRCTWGQHNYSTIASPQGQKNHWLSKRNNLKIRSVASCSKPGEVRVGVGTSRLEQRSPGGRHAGRGAAGEPGEAGAEPGEARPGHGGGRGCGPRKPPPPTPRTSIEVA